MDLMKCPQRMAGIFFFATRFVCVNDAAEHSNQVKLFSRYNSIYIYVCVFVRA